MNITNKLNLPQPILNAVKNNREIYINSHGLKPADISVTTLIAPPQIRVLSKKHADELEQDCSDMLFAFFGSAVHAYLDMSNSKGVAECRVFYTDLELNMSLSGMFDLLEDNILYDYKLMSVWSVINGVKPEYEAQLNVLDFLADHDDQEIVKELKIVAMLKDWSPRKARFEANYPNHQIMTIPVRKWSREQQAQYIKERMLLHLEAEQGKFVSQCTPEEMWATPEVFACMRNENKSSSKNCDSMEEAEAWINSKPKPEEYKIVERPREYKRCEDYCICAPFCEQYQGLKGE